MSQEQPDQVEDLWLDGPGDTVHQKLATVCKELASSKTVAHRVRLPLQRSGDFPGISMRKARKMQVLGKDFFKRAKQPSAILRQVIRSREIWSDDDTDAFAMQRRDDGSINSEFYSRRAHELRNAEIRRRADDLRRWLTAPLSLMMSFSARVRLARLVRLPSAGATPGASRSASSSSVARTGEATMTNTGKRPC